MAQAGKRYLLIAGGIFIFTVWPFFLGGALAQDPGNDASIIVNDHMFMSQEDVFEYWTAERMAKAIPMPLPEYVTPPGADNAYQIQMEKAVAAEILVPQVTLGWSPGSGPQPDPTVSYTVGQPYDPLDTADFQTYGSPPTDPVNGPYAPFQRWTWYGNYAAQDTQTIGKLFFTDGLYNYQCSASVIGRRTIATAAHCLNEGGGGGWYGGWLFCPSYYKAGGSGGPYPSRGCWTASAGKVSNAWLTTPGGAADRDYGCLVTDVAGDTVSDNVGNVTGWVGRAVNFPSQQPIFSWGYPAAYPFPGYHIIVASSPEWYEVDMTPGDGQVSKYIGNDMTGGASGGPWWLGVAHRTAEYPDTDGSSNTDPAGPKLNGVNSHRRITLTGQIFSQEVGSPQFRNTSGDTDESEDIFQWCLDQE